MKISVVSFLGDAAMHSPVLVVEDDADVRSLLVETLTDVGGFLVYAVETAGGA